eukprot:sb/3463604/
MYSSDKKVNNFTTDWNDGIALCSLVESIVPGLCPEYASLDPKNKLENAQLGLDRAELGLGVPKILEAEDLTHQEIDELSVITYVSMLMKADKKIDILTCFRRVWAVYKRGILLLLLLNVAPVDPLKVQIICPEGDAWVNKPTHFSVDTTGAGFGRLGVEILDGSGNKVEPELWKNGDLTKVLFTPTTPGVHKISVTYNTKEVPQGQFNVKVYSPADSSKLELSGDGLKTAIVNKPTLFTADATNAGDGDLEVTIVGAGGTKIPVDLDKEGLRYTVSYVPDKVGPVLVSVKFAGNEVDVVDGNGDPLKVTIGDTDPDNKRVSFTPKTPGNHRVNVTWSGKPVPDGDIDVPVTAPINVLACVVGPVGNPIVGQPTQITVDCSKVGSDDLGVEVVAADGKPLEVIIENKGEDKFTATYTPLNVGPLKVAVKVADQHAPGSMFNVHAIDPTKVTVSVDDSQVWKVGEPVEVDVGIGEAGPGNLGIQLSAPPGSGGDCAAKENIELRCETLYLFVQVSPGNMKVCFTPTTEGDHVIALTFQDQPVPATPVTVKVV